jgi:hypothetical protein
MSIPEPACPPIPAEHELDAPDSRYVRINLVPGELNNFIVGESVVVKNLQHNTFCSTIFCSTILDENENNIAYTGPGLKKLVHYRSKIYLKISPKYI